MLMPTEIRGEEYMTQGEAMEHLGIKDRVIFSKKMEEAKISWIQFPFLDKRRKWYRTTDIARLASARVEKQGKRTYDKEQTNHS